nr:immunoglobulin light chain junction region [Macaca mulatta]MOX73005.1 immunoglobulin light chain junction region [Macaca mulatta]
DYYWAIGHSSGDYIF